ncbi:MULTISPECIES: phosphohydrolase [unclassified Microbacterium]|uniref:phosphohydrolase n=1 Tax=unclassified Microbacterium TaxID=2609290 RepID=UPI003744F5CD
MAEDGGALIAWAERGGDQAAVWGDLQPGPGIAEIAARLSSVPRPFLDERLSVRALAGDVLGAGDLACLRFEDEQHVRTGAAMALWLIASEDVIAPFSPPLRRDRMLLAVDALAMRLAPVTPPVEWTSDDERREEAARTFLLWIGQLPAGEDVETARALLAGRDSLERNRSLAEAFEEHRHRAEVARRLAEARAREAAARYSSE